VEPFIFLEKLLAVQDPDFGVVPDLVEMDEMQQFLVMLLLEIMEVLINRQLAWQFLFCISAKSHALAGQLAA